MQILKSCPLPRVKEHIVTAWELEERFYDVVDDPLETDQVELPDILVKRKNVLTENDSQNGLFLTKANGEQLILRDGFAFWSDLEID